MGAGKIESSEYYTIFDGHICRRFKEATAASVKRINKQGTTVNEEYNDYLRGIITGISIREHATYGKSWIISLTDENGINCVLQMPYSGSYASCFLKILPNVNLGEPIMIVPSLKMQENGKKKASLFILQNGKGVKWYFTKENPRDLPPMVKVRFQGEDKYDSFEMMAYLTNMVKEKILPRLKSAPASIETDWTHFEEDDNSDSPQTDNTEPVEDLPF